MKMSVRLRLMSEYKPDAPARVAIRPLACAAGLYFHQPRFERCRQQLRVTKFTRQFEYEKSDNFYCPESRISPTTTGRFSLNMRFSAQPMIGLHG